MQYKIPRAIPVAAASFDLDDLSGLVFWQEMFDPASYTESGGFITAFTNKASGVAWPEATNRAAYLATGIDGKPAMGPDGNDRYISTEAAVFGALTNVPAFTFVYKAAAGAADSNETVFAVGNSTGANGVVRFGHTTTSTGKYALVARNNAGTTITVESTTAATNAAHTILWHGNGTTVTLNIDGVDDVVDAPFAPGALTPNRSALLCRPNSTIDVFWAGVEAGAALYSRRLTGPEITQVLGYVNTNW